jgi:hypothetical protein
MAGRIIKYSILLIAIIPVVFFFLTRENAPFGGRNSSFAVATDKEITGIEFSDGKTSLKLAKKGDKWMVNDKLETRKSSILFIRQILQGLEIKSPVSQELFDNEILKKNIKPVRVKVFENKRLIKSFYVYKTPSNIYGNIMKMREGAKPFIVYVPGYETEIGSAFTMQELFWQPYTIFNLLPGEISSVSLDNFSDPGSSFMIKKNGHTFILTDLTKEVTGWDTSRIIRYVSYFVHVPFESWDFNLSREDKEKLQNTRPAYRIVASNNNGGKIGLTLWERTVSDQGTLKKDTNRLWAKTDTVDEIFIVRYLDIDPILKKRSYFFP